MTEADDDQPRKSIKDRVAAAVKSDLGWTPEGREQRQRDAQAARARFEADRARRENTFAGIEIKDDRIESAHGGGPLAGARATVDAAGQLTARITATRLVLTGPLALGLRKTVDHRELYLIVEGGGWAISAAVDPDQGAKARAFAARINAAGSVAAAAEPNGSSAVAAAIDIPDQIRRLGEDGGYWTVATRVGELPEDHRLVAIVVARKLKARPTVTGELW
jgi:hypothetical protein